MEGEDLWLLTSCLLLTVSFLSPPWSIHCSACILPTGSLCGLCASYDGIFEKWPKWPNVNAPLWYSLLQQVSSCYCHCRCRLLSLCATTPWVWLGHGDVTNIPNVKMNLFLNALSSLLLHVSYVFGYVCWERIKCWEGTWFEYFESWHFVEKWLRAWWSENLNSSCSASSQTIWCDSAMEPVAYQWSAALMLVSFLPYPHKISGAQPKWPSGSC